MKVILILIILFILFLFDVSILSTKRGLLLYTYAFLMIVGFSILIIISYDLQVPSPAIIIQNFIEGVMGR